MIMKIVELHGVVKKKIARRDKKKVDENKSNLSVNRDWPLRSLL